jgi:hypothetical protein
LTHAFAKIRELINFTIDIAPEAILDIDDIAAYNQKEGF